MVEGIPGGWSHNIQRIQFPFRQYWVGEDIAPQAERAYLENSTREKRNVYVTVRVRRGDAAIENMFIGNVPLREYLRAHPLK